MQHDESSHFSTVADMAALGKLLEEHRDKLLSMVERRLDPALSARLSAEDVLSEAFLEAGRKWARFKSQSAMAPYAWLYRVVLDVLIEVWRRENRACRGVQREVPWPERSSVQLGLGLVSPQATPSQAAAGEELRERMRQVMAQLPDRDREILWMRHYDQLSFRDAAQVLGIKESAANVRYVRAVRRLKTLWDRLEGG